MMNDRFRSCRLLVVGDLMLDRYVWGDVSRISPEAPIPILEVRSSEAQLGGAASVARLARGLGATVTVAGILGDDQAGDQVKRKLEEAGIDTHLVIRLADRMTTVKERFIGRAHGRHPHQLLRVDREHTDPIDAETADLMLAGLREELEQYQAVLISDYAKGLCTPKLLEQLFRWCRERSIPTIADPARISDVSRYRGVSVFVPNRTEAELLTGLRLADPQTAGEAGRQLAHQTRSRATIVKLDREGMVLVRWAEWRWAVEHIPTRAREVYDVTGAGDTVLAVLGLGLASGMGIQEAVRLANRAAGLQVERLGIAEIKPEELHDEPRKDPSARPVVPAAG